MRLANLLFLVIKLFILISEGVAREGNPFFVSDAKEQRGQTTAQYEKCGGDNSE